MRISNHYNGFLAFVTATVTARPAIEACLSALNASEWHRSEVQRYFDQNLELGQFLTDISNYAGRQGAPFQNKSAQCIQRMVSAATELINQCANDSVPLHTKVACRHLIHVLQNTSAPVRHWLRTITTLWNKLDNTMKNDTQVLLEEITQGMQ